jgi:hypothetical protein
MSANALLLCCRAAGECSRGGATTGCKPYILTRADGTRHPKLGWSQFGASAVARRCSKRICRFMGACIGALPHASLVTSAFVDGFAVPLL